MDAQIPLHTFIDIFTVLVVRSWAIALVARTHVGAFQVGASTISADVSFQALVHIKALSIPAPESFCAGNTLVRSRRIHTLLTRTSTWSQTLINIFAAASSVHAVPTVTVFTPVGTHNVDAAPFPADIRPQAFIHIYAVSTLPVGHISCRADTQETPFSVFTASLGAEVLVLSTFIDINTFVLLFSYIVTIVAFTGVPLRQVQADPLATDTRVHGTFIDFCDLSRCDHLAGT